MANGEFLIFRGLAEGCCFNRVGRYLVNRESAGADLKDKEYIKYHSKRRYRARILITERLLDKGWKEPRCADACPTEALKFDEEPDLKDLIAKAEVLHPEFSAKPRVYYLNIPKKFVAGTVYDPVEKEVIIGATCTLSSTGKKLTATTDGFGDFWFEGLEEGIYSLKIEAKGFAAKTIDSINTKKDANLGDIPLS